MHNEHTSVLSLFTKIILEKRTHLFITINSLLLVSNKHLVFNKESHKLFGNVIQILLPKIIIFCHVQHLHFQFEVFSTKKKHFSSVCEVSKCPLSVLEQCPSYKEFSYSKMTKKFIAATNTRHPAYRGVS